MSERRSAIAAWGVFVLFVGTAAYLSLAACDIGPRPLFGLSYCRASERDGSLVAEQERERVLLDRLHEAQLNLARLPICLPETPPQQRAEIVPSPTPTPSPTPRPGPTPTPSPTSTPDDELTIPRNVAELKGCWQSVSGDIPFFTDDAEHRPLGSVRICYCFDDRGRGSSMYKYQDGTRCVGPLRVQVSEGRLSMRHPRINCVGNPAIGYVVGADVLCTTRSGERSASCDTDWHFRYPTTSKDEKFRRVSLEYCR